jgi:hypothetical protein
MWEWNSKVMQEAIFVHDSTIRQLIPVHYGVEVMTEGDAFIIAFHEPSDAIMYCLHAQDNLRRAAWPTGILEHENAAHVLDVDILATCSAHPMYQYIQGVVREMLTTSTPDSVRQPWTSQCNVHVHVCFAWVDGLGGPCQCAGRSWLAGREIVAECLL